MIVFDMYVYIYIYIFRHIYIFFGKRVQSFISESFLDSVFPGPVTGFLASIVCDCLPCNSSNSAPDDTRIYKVWPCWMRTPVKAQREGRDIQGRSNCTTSHSCMRFDSECKHVVTWCAVLHGDTFLQEAAAKGSSPPQCLYTACSNMSQACRCHAELTTLLPATRAEHARLMTYLFYI